MKHIGIQYTVFKKGGGFRQVFFNALAPPLLFGMSETQLVDWAVEILKGMHPDDMIMVDAVNRDGPVHSTYDFEA